MTDRHAGYIVVLDVDLRDDDAEPILNALRMISGVQSVEPIVADLDLHIAQSRADAAWQQRILGLLRKDSDD